MAAAVPSSAVLPQRHRSYEHARRFARRRSLLLRGDATPSYARWLALGQGLNRGDPLADAVVEEFQSIGHGPGMALAQQALTGGLASLPAAQRHQAPALTALFEAIETRPAWVDDELMRLGSRIIDRCHPTGYYVMRDAALMVGYLSRDLNKPLIMTGALHGGASRRVAQTMKWASDCCDAGGLARHGKGFHSTVHVRLLHAAIRRRILARPDWDRADMGLPINQTDMVATWLAFGVVYLAGLRALGVPIRADEARGVMHLWKYACWLIGVDENWLTDDEHEGRRLLVQVLSTYRGADESSRQLGRALMNEVPQIPFPRLRPLRWRLEQAKHLSVTQLIAGPAGMRKLGLPAWVPPWYPLATAPLTFTRHQLMHRLPPVQRWVERRGHRGRADLVQLHFGIETPDLAEFHDA